jgi:hypothetical protein
MKFQIRSQILTSLDVELRLYPQRIELIPPVTVYFN